MMEAVSNVSDYRFKYQDLHTKDLQFLDDKLVSICHWIILTVLCQGTDIFGTATNIMNIMCFVKQGFKDPVNVSLLGLAVSDLGCLTTLIFTNICYTPAFYEADLPFDPSDVQFIASGMPHIAFSRTTCWITAFITLERCLCITLPLQVKDIFTTKRVSIIIICLFIVMLSSIAPIYIFNRPGMKFFPERNQTLLGIIYTENRQEAEKIFYTINSVIVPFGAFMVIIVCTVTLVVQLRRNIQWRKKSTSSAQADNITYRNQKVAKLVVMVSSLFMACFVPVAILFIAMALEPGLSQDGKYRNMLTVFGGLILLFESINSSSNIFIYYHMSSRYRHVFQQLFCKYGELSSNTRGRTE